MIDLLASPGMCSSTVRMVHPRLFPSCLPHPLATGAAGSFRFVASFTLGPFSRESLSRARWISPLALGRAPFAFAFAPAFPLYDPVGNGSFYPAYAFAPMQASLICVAIVRLRRARSDGSTRGSPIGIRRSAANSAPRSAGRRNHRYEPLPGNARLLMFYPTACSGTTSPAIIGPLQNAADDDP